MNSGGPTSSRGKVNLETSGSGDGSAGLLVVAGVAVGVDAVLVGIHGEATGRKKGQVDLQVAWIPVGHSADIPVGTTSAGQHNVFGDFGVEHAGFIPDGGHRAQEFHDLGLA